MVIKDVTLVPPWPTQVCFLHDPCSLHDPPRSVSSMTYISPIHDSRWFVYCMTQVGCLHDLSLFPPWHKLVFPWPNLFLCDPCFLHDSCSFPPWPMLVVSPMTQACFLHGPGLFPPWPMLVSSMTQASFLHDPDLFPPWTTSHFCPLLHFLLYYIMYQKHPCRILIMYNLVYCCNSANKCSSTYEWWQYK